MDKTPSCKNVNTLVSTLYYWPSDQVKATEYHQRGNKTNKMIIMIKTPHKTDLMAQQDKVQRNNLMTL